MKRIKVFAPATVANLGCAFDVMGLALDGVGDIMEVGIDEGDEIIIRNHTQWILPTNIENNVVTPAIREMLGRVGKKFRVEVDMLEKVCPGSGIGSSSASSAAIAYALNELLGNPFSLVDLVYFSMLGEELIGGSKHADNSAPAVMGGVVLIRGYEPLDLIRLPVPDDLYYSVVHPEIVVTTKMARRVLPLEIKLHDAVIQWGNVGGLVAGFAMKDSELICRAMKDIVIEPYRKEFIPDFDLLRQKVCQAGAKAMNIAGSGPSVIAVSRDIDTARSAAQVMKTHFSQRGINSDTFADKVSNLGARTI